jgi:uncharacterized protein YkwD
VRWSTLTLATLAALALVCWAAGATPSGPAHAESPDGDGPGSRGARLSPGLREPLVEAVIELSNAERTKAELAPLRRNESLVQAAQEYAAVLAPGPCFEHTCPPVPALADRLTRARYTDFERISENIAAGDPTAAAVVRSWMGSPGHHANLLNPEYQEVGVGVETGGGAYTIYWVQLFGTRFR